MPDEVVTVKSKITTEPTQPGMFITVFFDFSFNNVPIDNIFKSRLIAV